MIAHDDLLPSTLTHVDGSAKMLRDYGDRDAELNYLYFLRDEVNKRIKAANRKRKQEAK